MPKSSTLLFLVILLFLLFSFISYLLLYKNINNNQKKNEEITFYKIQKETNTLLTKLLYIYYQKKDNILKKHNEVLSYLQKKSYDVSLENIYEKINQDLKPKPYNIYITDDNYIIRNTTYLSDLGFDLSFAKDIFLEHKKNNEIGISFPIFEFYSSKFFSYSDSFLPNSEKIIQISYTYNELDNDLKNLQDLLEKNVDIKSSNAFVIYDDGFIGDFIFKQESSQNINERAENAKILVQHLDENKYLTKYQDDNNVRISYLSEKSAISDKIKIIYSIVFDETNLKNSIFNLNIIISFLTIIGLATIYLIYKVRKKEFILSYKDKFIEHSVHEIKTPLSIINLNIQLRNKNLGEDKYSKKIEGAVKTLKNSYEDIAFLHTKTQIDYKIEKLNLGQILRDRVNYFEIIAKTQFRQFNLEIIEDYDIFMSEIELIRLIDNNLSNAIKYSTKNSTIKISLTNKTLEFQSFGNNIKNCKTIFHRFTRENESSGGHGLGLSIVKDICDKYKIDINVNSKDGINIFSYKFNCHKLDTNSI
ncbi:HAMP domain-containing sensor histidine kinase [Arcobacter sp. CECT 9188]|uniref:sensor histidine kinase n=1 Tax=Arcobacter sp. CECT 9188 TaxID=2044505 RepID=UPI000DEA672A|nr:HAMP domain-containing sensor histidine kinase [Arcobacter sp. CECT 9188]RBQ27781.1 hypothetical protein CRU88_03680 [Arcobacter sp. CECT 9188]